MSSIREFLDAPQFTDQDGTSRGESHLGRFGGNWVKAGEPRWKAFLFYGICLVGGLGLIATSSFQLDIFSMFGLLCLALGIAGGAEAVRNRPFTRVFGGPAKPKG